MDLWALNFDRVHKTAFTTTKRSICRIEKTFPEKTSILFFSVFGLEAWNCVFLSAIASRLSKRVPKNNPRKTFFLYQKRKKNGIWVTFFRPFGRTARRRVSKYSIQHYQMNNLGEKISEKFFFFYTCFHAWRTKSCSFGTKPKQVVKLCPEDKSDEKVFVDKKTRGRNWELSEFFSNCRPRVSSGLLKLQSECP